MSTSNHCENYPAMLGKFDDNGNLIIVRARCKMWACEFCAERNRIAWRYRIKDEIESDLERVWSFLTITAQGGEDRTPEITLAQLREGWQKFIRRARSHHKPEKLSYMRVYEKHDDGTYHCHALISTQYDDMKQHYDEDGEKSHKTSATVAGFISGTGLGWVHSVEPLRRIGLWGISNYVTKYLTKENDGDYPPKLRRFQTSQGFAKFRRDEGSDFRVIGSKLRYRDAREVWSQGGEIFDMNLGLTLESAHFDTKTSRLVTEDDTIYNPIDK